MLGLWSPTRKLQHLLAQKNDTNEKTKMRPPHATPQTVSKEPTASPSVKKAFVASGTEGEVPTLFLTTAAKRSRTRRSAVGMSTTQEGLCLSVIHERSGYSFSLTWLRQEKGGGDLMDRVSSLGMMERVAPDWMKDSIVFSVAMIPVFFQRICRVMGHR